MAPPKKSTKPEEQTATPAETTAAVPAEGSAPQAQPEKLAAPTKAVEKAGTPEPTIGRSVHYTAAQSGATQHAVIVELITGENGKKKVGLTVTTKHGSAFLGNVPFSPNPKEGHWNWPPRV